MSGIDRITSESPSVSIFAWKTGRTRRGLNTCAHARDAPVQLYTCVCVYGGNSKTFTSKRVSIVRDTFCTSYIYTRRVLIYDVCNIVSLTYIHDVLKKKKFSFSAARVCCCRAACKASAAEFRETISLEYFLYDAYTYIYIHRINSLPSLYLFTSTRVYVVLFVILFGRSYIVYILHCI